MAKKRDCILIDTIRKRGIFTTKRLTREKIMQTLRLKDWT